MQDEIWNQFGIQNYNGNVLSVYSVIVNEPFNRKSDNSFQYLADVA